MEDTTSIELIAVRKQFVISLARPALLTDVPNRRLFSAPASFQRTGVPNRCELFWYSKSVSPAGDTSLPVV